VSGSIGIVKQKFGNRKYICVEKCYRNKNYKNTLENFVTQTHKNLIVLDCTDAFVRMSLKSSQPRQMGKR